MAGRAPQGFADIGTVATEAELAEITQGYARLAGFAVTPGPASAKGAAQA